MIAVGDGDGENLSAQIDPQRPLAAAEQLVVVGTGEAVQQFLTQFEASAVRQTA